MKKPLSSHIDTDDILPSKDRFYKTNQIFNHLFQKNIVIKEDKTSMTNIIGFISVNFSQVVARTVVREYSKDEYLLNCNHTATFRVPVTEGQEVACYRCGSTNSYRNFEHEWSHIIFKSSPALFKSFVNMYSQYFSDTRMHYMITHIVNAFDDLRVNSLWNRVYPGSAGEIEQKWKSLCEADPDINTNLTTWLFGVATGAKTIGKGPFRDLIPIARKAADGVKGRGVTNMLVIVRWFLEQCLERLMDPEEEPAGDSDEKGNNDNETPQGKPENRDEAIEKLMQQLHDFRREQEHCTIDNSNYVHQINYKLSPEDGKTLTQIFNQKVDTEEIPDLQPSEEKGPIDQDMEQVVQTLQKAAEGTTTANQYLLAESGNNILIADILPENILPDAYIAIDDESQAGIDRMRAVFAKFIGKKITRLIDDGDEIDVPSYIQYRLDGQDEDMFEDEGLTKGFAYLTLCDMSQSMEGKAFSAVSTGSEMLKQALDYPFVRGHLWGFRGAIGEGSQNYVLTEQKYAALTKGGEVWIYKYHSDCSGYLAKEVQASSSNKIESIPVKCGGMTPTPTGLHVASRFLGSATPPGMEKKIFLLTDGNPTQFGSNGDMDQSVLFRQVRREVDSARSRNIQVYTVIVGNEIKDEDALEMFGPKAYWRRVNPELIGQALIEIVLKEFVRFLRT